MYNQRWYCQHAVYVMQTVLVQCSWSDSQPLQPEYVHYADFARKIAHANALMTPQQVRHHPCGSPRCPY